MPWFTYILECSDKSYYVGHTENVPQRVNAHNSGQGAVYTKHRRPISLAYHEIHVPKEAAMGRELQIKKWSVAKKIALINGDLKELHRLAKRRK